MKTKQTIAIIAAIFFLFAGIGAPAHAQGENRSGPADKEALGRGPGAGHGRGAGGGMGMHRRGMHDKLQRKLLKSLYPVRLVRRYAEEIKLTDAQMQKIRKIVTDVRAEVDQLQWDLEDATRKLIQLVDSNGTKEQIYTQMDRIFKYENKIKKKHMGLMIVVRDILTADQKAALDKIKQENRQQKIEKRKTKKGKRMGRRGPPRHAQFAASF